MSLALSGRQCQKRRIIGTNWLIPLCITHVGFVNRIVLRGVSPSLTATTTARRNSWIGHVHKHPYSIAFYIDNSLDISSPPLVQLRMPSFSKRLTATLADPHDEIYPYPACLLHMSSVIACIAADVPVIKHDRDFLPLFTGRHHPFKFEPNATLACWTKTTSNIYDEWT